MFFKDICSLQEMEKLFLKCNKTQAFESAIDTVNGFPEPNGSKNIHDKFHWVLGGK